MTSVIDSSKIDINSSKNEYADFWRCHIGVNVIPSKIISETKKDKDGNNIVEKKRIPIVHWKDYQTTPIPEWQHEQWKAENKFKDGMSVICGKVWHRPDLVDHYLIGFDGDNLIAVQEFLALHGVVDGNVPTIEQFAQRTLVEQHLDNQDKMHWFAYVVGTTLRDKTSDIGNPGMDSNTVPAFEVKATSKFLMHCAPGPHKNGCRIQFIGTITPFTYKQDQIPDLQQKIDGISKKYGLDTGSTTSNTSDNKIPIQELFKSGKPTQAGHNRHERILRQMSSLLVRNKNILPLELIKKMAIDLNTPEYFDPPLDDSEFEKQWKCSLEFVKERGYEIADDGNDDMQYGNGDSRRRQQQHQRLKEEESGKPKEHLVYKYSNGIILAEQIILDNKSVFLQIINDKSVISRQLNLSKEQNIILKPYQHGISGVASPIIPIKFRDIAEVEYFIKQARKETIESIYLKHRSLWKNFVVANNENTIIFLAVDSVYSHFQDLFETTHYDLIYGPPGSGKGAILITFSLLGYRVVLAADLNGANLLDLYGSDEICQITIAEDELDDIHRDPDKHKIYKIGYDFTGTTQRTLDGNTSNRNNRLYSVYGFKIGAAENQIESRVLAGFNDRGFQFHSIRGKPRYAIKKALKEMMKPAWKQLPKYRKVISQLEYTRKLTFIFRMLYHDVMIEEVEANIDGRALELTGPQIRLFCSKKLSTYSIDRENSLLEKEILPALSEFLRQKGELTKKTLDGIVYDAVVDLISCTIPREQAAADIVNGKRRILCTISNSDICERVKELVDGIVPQNPNEQAFYSVEYGKITHKHILKLCRDRLMAEPDSIGSGNEKTRALSFDKETVQKVGKTFEVINKIEILTDKQDVEEEHDNELDEQLDRQIWSNWSSTYSWDESGTMGRKLPLSEDIHSNDGTKQQYNNNNASNYNYENSLSNTHIIQDNANQNIKFTSISNTLISKDQSSFDSSICSQIDPKIVPLSQTLEAGQEANSSIHKCPYCNITGHDITFSNTDLLEMHVVQRHPGWTAYPGPPDIEKYKLGLKGK